MAAVEVATSADGSTWVGHKELTGTEATVTFGSTSVADEYIKQTYDHLWLVMSARTDRGAAYDTLQFRLNGDDTGGNYPFRTMYATGSATPTPAGGNNAVQPDGMITDIAGGSSVADFFGTAELWIPHYTNTVNYKQCLATGGRSTASTTDWYAGMAATQFIENTAAITEVLLLANGGSFVQYSTFTLYGVTGA